MEISPPVVTEEAVVIPIEPDNALVADVSTITAPWAPACMLIAPPDTAPVPV